LFSSPSPISAKSPSDSPSLPWNASTPASVPRLS
jgi:hypothetical protein